MNHDIGNEELLFQLATFAKGESRGLYAGFTPEVLRDYLVFHANQGTLSFSRENGAITGLGVAWQMRTAEIRWRQQYRKTMFQWEPTDPEGDALFLADIVAVNPLARRALLAGMMRRFPNWARLKIFTYRKPRRLVEIKPLALARLTFGHEPASVRAAAMKGSL